MIMQVLLGLCSYLGLLVGIIITYFTESELESAKPYFAIAQVALLSAVITLFFNHLQLPIIIIVLCTIGLFLLLLYLRSHQIFPYIAYGQLAIVAAEMIQVKEIIYVLTLIFVFGMVHMSLYARKNRIKVLFSHMYFFVFYVLFLFV